MPSAAAATLYMQVVRKIETLIHAGTLRPGERIPSVRKATRQYGVSVTTVAQAYLALEDMGLIEARPKSGFFVRPQFRPNREPRASRPASAVTAVSVGHLQSRLFEAARMPGLIPFGGAAPGPELLPTARLNRLLASVSRTAGSRGVSYDLPPGTEALRREIARRSIDAGVHLSPEDIIITCGGTEALLLCLRAATSRGDIVAVESPTYFGLLHALEELGLNAVEIPCCPRNGMDLDALETALKSHRIAACISIPNFSNPLGSLMPDAGKERLVSMLAAKDVPLIEDDVFGELHYGTQRPRLARSMDRKQLVMVCSSFSKTLAPGYRVGWAVPGRYFKRVQTLKLTTTLVSAPLPQLAIAEFLSGGGYDHYLRSVRRTYAANIGEMSRAVAASFPAPVKMTRPQGGFVLWVEMPKAVDALQLDDLALAAGISIAPGPMFSAKRKYRNFIRLSCAHPWTEQTEQAVNLLGKLAARLMKTG